MFGIRPSALGLLTSEVLIRGDESLGFAACRLAVMPHSTPGAMPKRAQCNSTFAKVAMHRSVACVCFNASFTMPIPLTERPALGGYHA